jgi:hypothetical protein
MKYLLLALRYDGIIFTALNPRFCIAHYKNLERLDKQAADPVRQAAIGRYVDALWDAGDLR